MKHIMAYKENKMLSGRRSGFTLIEIIIMMLIVSVSIVGINKIYLQVINDSREKNREVVAANLAQEFVEVVREIRDANYKPNTAWTAGLTGCATYVINDFIPSGDPTLSCADASNSGICESGNGYVKCASAGSEYVRTAILQVVEDDAQEGQVGMIKVDVRVTWNDADGQQRKVEVKDTLYHWQNYAADEADQNVMSTTANAPTAEWNALEKIKFAYYVPRNQGAADILIGSGDYHSEIGRAKFQWIYADSDAASKQADWRILDSAGDVIAKPENSDQREETVVYVPLCQKGTQEVKDDLGCNGNMADFSKDLNFRLVIWDDSGNVTKVPEDDSAFLKLRTTTQTQISDTYISNQSLDNICLKRGTYAFSWAYTDPSKLQSYYFIDITGPTNQSFAGGDANNEQRVLSGAQSVAQTFSRFIDMGAYNYGDYTWNLISRDINYGDNWDGSAEGETWAQKSNTFRINQPIDVACGRVTNQSPAYFCNPTQILPKRTCVGAPCATVGNPAACPFTGGCDAPRDCNVREDCGTSPCVTQGGGCTTFMVGAETHYKCWDSCYDCWDNQCQTCFDCSEQVDFTITDDANNCEVNKPYSVTGAVSCSGSMPVGSNTCSRTWTVQNGNCSFSGTVTVRDGTLASHPLGYTTDTCNY